MAAMAAMAGCCDEVPPFMWILERNLWRRKPESAKAHFGSLRVLLRAWIYDCSLRNRRELYGADSSRHFPVPAGARDMSQGLQLSLIVALVAG